MLSYQALRDLLDVLAVNGNWNQGGSGLDVLNSVLVWSHLNGVTCADHRVPIVIWTHIALNRPLLPQLDLSWQLLLARILVPGVRVQSSKVIGHMVVSNLSFYRHITRDIVSRLSNPTFELLTVAIWLGDLNLVGSH